MKAETWRQRPSEGRDQRLQIRASSQQTKPGLSRGIISHQDLFVCLSVLPGMTPLAPTRISEGRPCLYELSIGDPDSLYAV